MHTFFWPLFPSSHFRHIHLFTDGKLVQLSTYEYMYIYRGREKCLPAKPDRAFVDGTFITLHGIAIR